MPLDDEFSFRAVPHRDDDNRRDLSDLNLIQFFSLQRSVLAMYLATFIAWVAGLRAAVFLHNILLSNVLKCPMEFYEVTPKGRLLARFSHDINTIDDRLINNFRQVLITGSRVR